MLAVLDKQINTLMPDNSEKNIGDPKINSYLPDFCHGDVFLRLLLVVELFAIVFALVSFGGGRLFVHIALISVVMLWVGLTTAATLCFLSRQRLLGDHLRTTIIAIAVTLLMTVLASPVISRVTAMAMIVVRR